VTLAVLFILAELADLGTYLQAPHLESNPAMQGWPPAVVAAKFVALTAVAALALLGLTGRKQTFTLGVCLAIAAFSFGTNAHALVVVDAAPTSATQPAPVTSSGTGNEQGTQAPAAGSRTPAPRPYGAVGTPVIHGLASWVSASLGARYLAARVPRGTLLQVCGPLACMTRTVTDYGPSKRVFPGRVVDLSRADFVTVCGDPERLGVCPVDVQRVSLSLPRTDR
jgi:hypothetical protein